MKKYFAWWFFYLVRSISLVRVLPTRLVRCPYSSTGLLAQLTHCSLLDLFLCVSTSGTNGNKRLCIESLFKSA